jgi:hypothetical protein
MITHEYPPADGAKIGPLNYPIAFQVIGNLFTTARNQSEIVHGVEYLNTSQCYLIVTNHYSEPRYIYSVYILGIGF